ncbi:MAG: CBS domain-containing protein [Gemmatimonadetes bacterium]|nr:CBS domain-containing protein [Gemmatimonadota bacterium]NIR77930.1 CBS domain-containing protein [Gemmatimonadota bacterium]NIT87096.1 CBS domain-containing protein [Gemmatimonadota bacterium]NIU30938.1 CBS domain-containing protein [Gemmatimonadota bacterium]NIU35213.1 CBS domain-containing protein [Gemmatimonadota bacterium]
MTFFDLAVSDLMATELVTVRPDMTVAELLELLDEKEITGVPVVASDGAVEGVVSLTDVARAAGLEASTGELPERRTPDRSGRGKALEGGELLRTAGLPHVPSGSVLETIPRTKLGGRPVRDIMNPATFSVGPDTSIGDLARFLSGSGIHRALVIDDEELVGIVTAMDVVRALADAPPER